MVDNDAPLGQQFFDVTVGKAVAQIPANGDGDDVGWEPEPGELRAIPTRGKGTSTSPQPAREGTRRPNATVPYELVLQMIARYFAFGHETPEQRQVLAHAAVRLMVQTIKPLGLVLARLPVGPDHPGATAGANFQLPYRANFLLPHRRSAWLRFAERLDELAAFAAELHPTEGRDVVGAVSGALGRMASELMTHVEAV